MSKFVHQIIAMFCLVAMVAGNPMTGCLCDMLPPQAACNDHDHSVAHNDDAFDQSDTRHGAADDGCNDGTCHCATCHSCHHMVIALVDSPVVAITAARPDRPADPAPADVHWVNGIFAPPKLS